MRVLRKSIILFASLTLLISAVLTSCDFSKDGTAESSTPEETPIPDYKGFGNDPYRIDIQDGVAVIDFNPFYTEPFVLEIPETDENGNPVTAVNSSPITGMLPIVMSEEDFAVVQGRLEEYFGVTYEDAQNFKIISDHPQQTACFYLCKYMAYFEYKSLDLCTSDKIKEALIEAFPIAEKMNFYVLDPTARSTEIATLYVIFREVAPELADEWYYEACGRTEYPYSSGVGETMTEIRFPSGITEIGGFTFAGCRSLRSVTVPGSVETVQSCAFVCCEALEEITFSEGVKVLGEGILSGFSQLKTVNLPASLESIAYPFTLYSGFNSTQPEFPTINYAGTVEQWKELVGWREVDGEIYYSFEGITVHCSDGTIELN